MTQPGGLDVRWKLREVICRLSKIFAGKIFRHKKSADNQCPKKGLTIYRS